MTIEEEVKALRRIAAFHQERQVPLAKRAYLNVYWVSPASLPSVYVDSRSQTVVYDDPLCALVHFKKTQPNYDRRTVLHLFEGSAFREALKALNKPDLEDFVFLPLDPVRLKNKGPVPKELIAEAAALGVE